MLVLLLILVVVSVEVTAVTTLVDVVSEAAAGVVGVDRAGGKSGDVGRLTAQGTGELGGVLVGEYEGRRTVISFGMGPGLRLLGGRDELSPPPEPRPPDSELESDRLRPFEDDEVAPTMSISASSTIMRLSILKGLPVTRDDNIYYTIII